MVTNSARDLQRDCSSWIWKNRMLCVSLLRAAKRLMSDVERDIEEEVRSNFSIVHNNQPILMEVFRDPVTEKDKVIVVASILGVTTDVGFYTSW
jgi:hypothetical protein